MDTITKNTERTLIPAIKLEIGDALLNDDGTLNSIVYDVFTDDYGTWLETEDTLGYVNPNQLFRVEYSSYEL